MLHIKEHLDLVSFSIPNSAVLYTENFPKLLISFLEDSLKKFESSKI